MTNKKQVYGLQDVLSRMVLKPKQDLAIKSKINKGINKLDQDVFFGFENVESQLEKLQNDNEGHLVATQMAKRGFPELDFTFLSWRKKDSKLPAFMVLDLETGVFSITVESSGDPIPDLDNLVWSISPELPNAITTQFEDVVVYLGQLSSDKYDDDEIAITAQFDGVMPIDVRKKTRKALEDEVFDNIFVICEAPTWTINKTGRTDKKDPLVVGWVADTEQMFLIASFDITSLEDYVLTQFKK